MKGVSKTILIVEDDSDLRRLFRMQLGLAGFTVQDVTDGVEALRLIDEQPPDLVVLDLWLPTISGLAVQQEIAAHAHTRHIPIVIVTGSDMEVPDAACVLRKPVSPEKLLQTIRACLTSGAPGAHS